MPVYRIVATTTTAGNPSVVRRARCQAPNLRDVLQKLLTRFPTIDSALSVSIVINIDDEEDLT